MMSVSGVSAGAVQPLTMAGKLPGAPEVRNPEETQNRRLRPAMDEYVRSEAPEGEQPDPAGQGAKGPEGKKGKDETWKCSTDKIDREIEKLKKKRQELEQQLSTETDEARIKDLERQLSRVEQELKRKDNDTYRRRNAVFTQLE